MVLLKQRDGPTLSTSILITEQLNIKNAHVHLRVPLFRHPTSLLRLTGSSRCSFATILALLLALRVNAAPLPQIGGDAQACYSILNNIDNGSGYAVENIENNTADVISGQHTGSNSEAGSNGNTGTNPAPAPAAPKPAPPHRRELELVARQLNKIVAGLGNLGTATKTSGVVDPIVNAGDTIDTIGTDGQGQLGDQIGQIEDPGVPELANELTDINP